VWLVMGLGNPGREYEATYHNVGFRVIEQIAEQHAVRIRQECGPALISDKLTIGDCTVVLVEPQTFMNRSGLALPKVFERFDATINELIVVYDDLALPLGKLRVRQKGSAGGHNGIKSLISSTGTDEFMRVRVGIMPDRDLGDVRDFVLSRVASDDQTLLVETLIVAGIEKAMAEYNGIDLREGSAAEGRAKDN